MRRVILTGSTGNLGGKAVDALSAIDGLELVRMGRNRGDVEGVISVDLLTYSESWASLFRGADAVMHLAADPKPVSDWASIADYNIDLALNVFRAAEDNGVRRFVFASSNWVLGGYRFGREQLGSGLPPRPVNPYGASKLFIERLGLAIAARSGMSFLGLRIGYAQKGDNRPGPHMAFGHWGQEMWLSNRDWAQAVILAVMSEFTGSAVLNIVSRNKGMRWDLDEADRTIGYVPEDVHCPALTPIGELKDMAARIRERLAPQGAPVPLFGERW